MSWPQRGFIACSAAVLALLACACAARAATSTCATPADAAPVFSAFGDSSLYVPVPGGSFEAKEAQRWTLTKGASVAGNEPWHVRSAKDKTSLGLTTGGQAVSPAVCIDATRPWWRFFAYAPHGSTATTLSVWAQWTATDGSTVTTPVTTLVSGRYRSWAPTPQLVLGSALGSGTPVNAKLFFTTAGKWQIDDVYVDPYAK